ncbi:MAG: pyridoxamine 5'-phosphate oxidase [Candidatus Puniceispirillaceae bacterium]
MGVLDADKLDIDPYQLFDSWFAEAKEAEINDPDAMAIASVDSSGMPSVRMVLLKEIVPEGFVFYTNYTSRKSAELLATGKAAFVMHWKSLRRQVRVCGQIEKVSAAQSDAYFNSRPRGSRVGAWASDQSKPLATRQILQDAVADVEANYGEDIPRPPHWGGFLIKPDEIEFWADGEYRLHDRFRYTKSATATWQAQRLYP